MKAALSAKLSAALAVLSIAAVSIPAAHAVTFQFSFTQNNPEIGTATGTVTGLIEGLSDNVANQPASQVIITSAPSAYDITSPIVHH
jgi:hypothetical protein